MVLSPEAVKAAELRDETLATQFGDPMVKHMSELARKELHTFLVSYGDIDSYAQSLTFADALLRQCLLELVIDGYVVIPPAHYSTTEVRQGRLDRVAALRAEYEKFVDKVLPQPEVEAGPKDVRSDEPAWREGHGYL